MVFRHSPGHFAGQSPPFPDPPGHQVRRQDRIGRAGEAPRKGPFNRVMEQGQVADLTLLDAAPDPV